MLRRVGALVVELPLIAIVDVAGPARASLEDALAGADSYDWLVVTSPNGAQRVRALLPPTDSTPTSTAASTSPKFAAIGTGTEQALGRRADLVPARSIAEGLLDEWPQGTGRVLLVQGDQARDALAEGLRERGWLVDQVVAYRNVAVVPEPALLERAAAADAITFMSGSAVRSYVDAAGADRLPPLVVSVGPATTAVAASLGLHVSATAAEHSASGVVSALIQAVRSSAAGG
jgi:uroporphyrinogen-III synthase